MRILIENEYLDNMQSSLENRGKPKYHTVMNCKYGVMKVYGNFLNVIK